MLYFRCKFKRGGIHIRKVTIYDIAKLANASPTTVSRVLSRSDYPVSEELANRIKQVAEELKYVPNLIGRQLKKQSSMTIGVVVPTISNSFYSEVVLGIEKFARDNGYHILLCNSHQNIEIEKQYLQMLFELQVDGVIISPIQSESEWLVDYQSRGLKIVTIDQRQKNTSIRHIGFDYELAGHMATQYLIDNGHQKIAFATAPLDRASRIDFYYGYLKALQDNNIELNEQYVFINDMSKLSQGKSTEFENGKYIASRILASPEELTAVLCVNDLTAIGIINVLNEQNYQVPQQLSVVGCDNVVLSTMVSPTLTTIHHPKYEMGSLACERLIQYINTNAITDLATEVLKPELIIRKSVQKIN